MSPKLPNMGEVGPPNPPENDDFNAATNMETLRGRLYANFESYGESYLMANDSYFRPIVDDLAELKKIEKAVIEQNPLPSQSSFPPSGG